MPPLWWTDLSPAWPRHEPSAPPVAVDGIRLVADTGLTPTQETADTIMLDDNFLLSRLITWIPLVLSLPVHEWAHAWSAWRLGDDTASLQGRMTLNPLAHIDPIGTVLLPLLGVPFGWARPVPVNPFRFRGVSMRGGMMLTALAGPLSNIALAVLLTVVLAVMVRLNLVWDLELDRFYQLIAMVIGLNVILATFNFLPIPPLDGSRVADYLMPGPLRPIWDSFQHAGPVTLILVILLPQMIGASFFAWPMRLIGGLFEVLLKLLGA